MNPIGEGLRKLSKSDNIKLLTYSPYVMILILDMMFI